MIEWNAHFVGVFFCLEIFIKTNGIGSFAMGIGGVRKLIDIVEMLIYVVTMLIGDA